MVDKLLNEVLSEQAKKIISKEYIAGKALAVTSQFMTKYLLLEKEIVHLIKLGWGEKISKYIFFYYGNDVNEVLENVQLSIIEESALFAFGIMLKKNMFLYYISINHALADEDTLDIFIHAIKIYSEKKYFVAQNIMINGRKKYIEYVNEESEMKKNFFFQENLNYQKLLEPIKLSENFYCDENLDLICFTKEIKLRNYFKKENILRVLLKFMADEGFFKKGNTICSSTNWRRKKYSKAIGMMTGISPIYLDSYDKQDINLELFEKCDTIIKKILNACINSDVFINGAEKRKCHFNKNNLRIFPVGIELEMTEKFKLIISIEGKFIHQKNVEKFLEKLTTYLN